MFNSRPLEDFVAQVSATEAGNKKDLRLSIDTARKIADSISYLLLALTECQQQSQQLKTDLQKSQVSEVELQGGKF